MYTIIRNKFHQWRIHRLLLFDPTHAGKLLTHDDNLEMAAVARYMSFLQRQGVHQYFFDFVVFHKVKLLSWVEKQVAILDEYSASGNRL